MSHPTIIAIVATSIDGRIALHANHPSDWTSPEDKAFMHDLLDRCDVIVVGNSTYKAAREPLSKRNCIVFTRSVTSTEQQRENLLLCNPAGADVKAVLQKYKTVAVLGGTQIYTYFLDHNLLDELFVTIEPLVFGRGLCIFEAQMASGQRFALASVKQLNQSGSVLLHYRRV